jgi:pimeloyl-ACP methyl ester carboxylesterase
MNNPNKSALEQDGKKKAVSILDSITVSDGSVLRSAYFRSDNPTAKSTAVLLGGWGDTEWASHPLAKELIRHLHVVIIESREKHKSILNAATRNDLRRLALDVLEIARHYSLVDAELAIYGYSWGSLIAASVVAHGLLRPRLTVLCTPIERLVLPPLAQFLVPLAPVGLMPFLQPILEYWVIRFKSDGPEAALPALRALRNANLCNWKAVGRANLSTTLASVYSQLTGPVLVIFLDGDRFHSATEYERIRQQTPNAKHVYLAYTLPDLPVRIAGEIRKMIDIVP